MPFSSLKRRGKVIIVKGRPVLQKSRIPLFAFHVFHYHASFVNSNIDPSLSELIRNWNLPSPFWLWIFVLQMFAFSHPLPWTFLGLFYFCFLILGHTQNQVILRNYSWRSWLEGPYGTMEDGTAWSVLGQRPARQSGYQCTIAPTSSLELGLIQNILPMELPGTLTFNPCFANSGNIFKDQHLLLFFPFSPCHFQRKYRCYVWQW